MIILNDMNLKISKNNIIQIFVLILVSALSSCSSDSEEDLFNQVEIKDISFSEQIVPLVETNCYGCHSMADSANGAGIVLEGYDNIKTQIEANKFLEVLTGANGLSLMPPFGQLSETQIQIVEQWITEGAQNN